jgi:hypothetical protein
MSSNTILTTIALFCLSFTCVAQPAQWPDGLYFEFDSFLSRSPDVQHPIQLRFSSPRSISDDGASPYRFSADAKGMSNYKLNVRPWVIVHDGEVYVNTSKMELGNGFSRSLTRGHFLIFPVNTSNTDAVSAGGAALLLLTGFGPGRNRTLEATHFVLSLRTGNSRLFTRQYVEDRLEESPSLLASFKAEPAVTDSVLVHYIELFNRSLEDSVNER